MLLWAPFLLFQLQPLVDVPDRNPYTSANDIAQGKRLYMGRCAGCHGPTGDGGKGANLAVPKLPRASEDRALYRIIRFGIQDTEMPGSLMDNHELWQTAAFVRTLGQFQSGPVSGNPQAGAEIFRTTGGCLGCHALGAEGGRTGPSLTGIGARRSVGHLRAKILDPSASVPDQFRLVRITTKSGRSASGIRVNEDTFSIQLRDSSGNFQSFWKDEIAKLSSEKKTNMPAYKGRLSEAQINDLVAFLSSQRGEQ